MEESDFGSSNPIIGSFVRVGNNVLDGNVMNVPTLDPLIFTPATGRSKCWRHFAFRTIKGYIDKSRAICRWCMSEIKNVGNTTNLQNHLRRHHVKEIDTDDIGGDKATVISTPSSSSQQTAVSNPVTTALAQLNYYHNNPYNMENPRSKQVTQAILDYFISDVRPLSTVENEAFLGLFVAIDPMYAMFTLPDVSQLERLLQEKYQVQKAVVGHTLQSAECVAIAVEKVKCGPHNRLYVILSASFITPEWQRFTKTLNSFETKECTPTQLKKLTVQTMEDWNLTSKQIGMITDTEYSSHSNDLSNVEQYPCLQKTLSSAASSVFDLSHVFSTITKVRQLVSQCQTDREVKAALDSASIQTPILLLDSPEYWTSTTKMLQRFKQQRNTIQRTLQGYDFSDEEVKTLDTILEMMQPLLTVAEALSEEVLPSIALILPLYNHLLQTYSTQNEQLQEKESSIQKDMASKLSAILNECQLNSIDRLKVATVIDPRFKGLQFMPTKEMREYAYGCVSHAASQLPNHTECDTDSKNAMEDLDQPSTKRIKTEPSETASDSSCSHKSETNGSTTSKSRAMSALFGTVLTKDTHKSPFEKAENEMHRFRAEEQLGLDGDPLQWWRSHEASYPLLSQLARQFLCIPATCIPPKELFATDSNTIKSKMTSIEAHLLNSMVFLNKNT